MPITAVGCSLGKIFLKKDILFFPFDLLERDWTGCFLKGGGDRQKSLILGLTGFRSGLKSRILLEMFRFRAEGQILFGFQMFEGGIL